MPGEHKFKHLIGITVAPQEGTDHEVASIIFLRLMPPSGGFIQASERAGGHLQIPLNCPSREWLQTSNATWFPPWPGKGQSHHWLGLFAGSEVAH